MRSLIAVFYLTLLLFYSCSKDNMYLLNNDIVGYDYIEKPILNGIKKITYVSYLKGSNRDSLIYIYNKNGYKLKSEKYIFRNGELLVSESSGYNYHSHMKLNFVEIDTNNDSYKYKFHYDILGNIEKIERRLTYTNYKYDFKNRVIEKENFSTKYKIDYDKDTVIIKYFSSGYLRSVNKKYQVKNYIKSVLLLYDKETGNISEKYEYLSDKENDLIKTKRFNADMELEYELHKFYKNGECNKWTNNYILENRMDTSIINYKFDRKGNWIKADNKYMNQYRVIEYF